jgi:hypothetical protein
MPSPRPRHHVSALPLHLVLALSAAGCGPAGPGDDPGRHHRGAPEGRAPVVLALPTASCELGAADAVALVAMEDGVALGRTASGPAPGLVVTRHRGAGCALAPAAGPPTAVHALLDADEAGNVYAFPRATTEPGVVSTLPEGSGDYSVGVVVRIDPHGRVSKVLEAGRGIWRFGVSPGGGAFFTTSCGPTGIFVAGSDPLQPVMTPPQTQWQSSGSALTDDHTLWSLGSSTCDKNHPVGPGCGHPLVRSTPAGSRELGFAETDFGDGPERTDLVRCGGRVCGVAASAVVVWDHEGAVARTITARALGVRPGERIAQVAGNRRGVYVLLHDGERGRLSFTPLR